MKAIYKVNFGEAEGRFFSSMRAAMNFAKLVMQHFGGEWVASTPRHQSTEAAFVSERIYEEACTIARMYVIIRRVDLDQNTLPRLSVKDTYTTFGGETIYKLGR